MATEATTVNLVSISGPRLVRETVRPPGPVTIGRLPTNDIELSPLEVSRHHAHLAVVDSATGPAWAIVDLDSSSGTYVNDEHLAPHEPRVLGPDDSVRISPWIFRLFDPDAAVPAKRLSTFDDTGTASASLHTIEPRPADLAREQLRLLLGCAEAIPSVTDRLDLADAILGAAVSGTGFGNAALLQPMRADGSIDLIAARGAILSEDGDPVLSRGLIRHAAEEGVPVQLSTSSMPIATSQSIVGLEIREAVCIPIIVEDRVEGFLYLDRRGQSASPAQATREAASFAAGLGRLAALALSNLDKRDLELRHARVEGEVAAAIVAQREILPPREGTVGRVTYRGECRPGRGMSGDFFDVIPLDADRTAVSFGDVAGKGIPASVVMSAAQGFLNAALRRHADPARAVTDFNSYLHERSTTATFATLWLAVIDAAAREIRYVDAGHGYAMALAPDGAIHRLDEGGGIPVGADEASTYPVIARSIAPGARLVIVSDGIVEQPAPVPEGAKPDLFGRERTEACLRALAPDDDAVQALFKAVRSHGRTDALADDATVLVVTW